MIPRVMLSEDRDRYLISPRRRVRLWVKKADRSNSPQVELELNSAGHFTVRVLSPIGTALTETQLLESNLFEQAAG